MKKTFLFLTLLTVAVLTGCSKTDGPTPDENCLVTQISGANWQWTFEYDDQGRVSVATENGVVYNFTYLDETIEVKKYSKDQLEMDYVYKLDAEGRITNGYEKDRPYGDTRYVYNADGFLKLEFTYLFGRERMLSLEYEDGNLVYWKSDDVYEPVSNSIHYDTEESNYPYSSVLVDLYGPTFVGAVHKSVLLEAGYFGKKSRSLPIHAMGQRFKVEKDSKGKIIQVNETVAGTDIKDFPWTLKYQCD